MMLYNVPSFVAFAISCIFLLMLVVEIELFILSIRQRRIFDTIHLIIDAIVFSSIIDDESIFIERFGGHPWLLIILYIVLSITIIVIRARIIYYFRKSRITRSSIKEAIDLLPIGLCLINEYGNIVFLNLKMREYLIRLTGNRLIDGNDFWKFITDNGEKNGDNYFIKTDDGKDLSFEKDSVLMNGRSYDQVLATDISEQASLWRILEEKNEKLRDVQYRMKAYQVRAADMFMDQELLTARVAVHDGLGGLLLQCRAYLEGRYQDEEELIRELRYTNGFLLSESKEREQGRDAYEEGLRMAEGIGVKVSIEGEEPESPFRDILGKAIGECAANTIKHAGGDEVHVQISEEEITITNNGNPPKEEINETGGLLSLRQMVEKAGGSLVIEYNPEFKLKIILRDDVSEGKSC